MRLSSVLYIYLFGAFLIFPCVSSENEIIKNNNTNSKMFSMISRTEYDVKLAEINGKNGTSYPTTEKLYNYIVSLVGKNNTRPFTYYVGPKIEFHDMKLDSRLIN